MRPSPRGSALVEVIIAVLLLAMAGAAVFGALVTASRQGATGPEREQASLQVEALLDELRNFTTADTSEIPSAPGDVHGSSRTWTISGDACNCWALAAGPHDVTARLPASLRVGRQARLGYTVAEETVNGLLVRRVNARLDWETPP